jgi:NADH dehydrogenase
VDDLAALAVAQGSREENAIIDAVGPETFAFRELVAAIGRIIDHRRLLVPTPPAVACGVARMLGRLVGDVMLTHDEIRGLMEELLYVEAAPAGATALTAWAREHREELGRRYASELARRRAPERGSPRRPR